jgi:hypothetical protein
LNSRAKSAPAADATKVEGILFINAGLDGLDGLLVGAGLVPDDARLLLPVAVGAEAVPLRELGIELMGPGPPEGEITGGEEGPDSVALPPPFPPAGLLPPGLVAVGRGGAGGVAPEAEGCGRAGAAVRGAGVDTSKP